jgi:hypothetical protein
MIRGSLELSDGPLRTAAVLYLPNVVSCSPASRPPLRYINRLFSAKSRQSAILHGLTHNPCRYVLLPALAVFAALVVSELLSHTLH